VQRSPSTGRNRLTIAATAFLAANLLHGIDHERQGTERLTTEVKAGGVVLTLLAILALIVVLRRSSRAPLVATAVGFWAAINVSAAHIAPHWSALSDSYSEVDADALAWSVMLLEVATALLLAIVGLRALLAHDASSHAPAQVQGG
jgi:quinol-cytochrome oxidoreductase complex cytochrome b subunit